MEIRLQIGKRFNCMWIVSCEYRSCDSFDHLLNPIAVLSHQAHEMLTCFMMQEQKGTINLTYSRYSNSGD